jgi:hypothetical protein
LVCGPTSFEVAIPKDHHLSSIELHMEIVLGSLRHGMWVVEGWFCVSFSSIVDDGRGE